MATHFATPPCPHGSRINDCRVCRPEVKPYDPYEGTVPGNPQLVTQTSSKPPKVQLQGLQLQGWQCLACKSVWAPFVRRCERC